MLRPVCAGVHCGKGRVWSATAALALKKADVWTAATRSVLGILFTFWVMGFLIDEQKGSFLLFGLWAFLYMNKKDLLYMNKKDPFYFLGEQGLRQGLGVRRQ